MNKMKSVTDPGEVMAQLAALPTMQVRHLQRRYYEVFDEVTRSRNRDYLMKKIAWRIQALAEGGLSDQAKARLEQIDPSSPNAPRAGTRRKRTATRRGDGGDPRLPAIGTILARTFQGVEHRVTVVAAGFEYAGEIHRSLSRVARLITGTSWNGWTFFGLR